MFRVYKRVSDMEFEMAHIPRSRLEMFVRKDLYNMMLEKFEQDGLNIEDYLIRYTSRRDATETNFGREWFTEFQLVAVPLRNTHVTELCELEQERDMYKSSGEDMEIINEIKSRLFDVYAPEKIGTEEWWSKHYGAEWPETEGDGSQ